MSGERSQRNKQSATVKKEGHTSIFPNAAHVLTSEEARWIGIRRCHRLSSVRVDFMALLLRLYGWCVVSKGGAHRGKPSQRAWTSARMPQALTGVAAFVRIASTPGLTPARGGDARVLLTHCSQARNNLYHGASVLFFSTRASMCSA